MAAEMFFRTKTVRPELLMQLFQTLLEEFRTEGVEHIALDGKSVHGFYKSEGHRILHSVSAYATQNGLSLSQVITHNAQGKEEGEFQAAQKLLEILDAADKVFTADAGFCHRIIAENTVNKGGNYIFQLKKNQIKLYEKVAAAFSEIPPGETFTEVTQGHGREETRVFQVLSTKGVIDEKHSFPGLQSILRIVSTRQSKNQKKTCSHWHIENKLHHVLDITFREDASRTRNLLGAENLLIFRRAALSLLHQVKNRDTIPRMLLKAAFSREYCTQILSRLR